MITIGDRLKHLRIDILRLSQEEMAGLMGAKARQTIADYETNKTIPNVIQLKQICNKYPTISFDWLVSGEGESPGESRERITGVIKNIQAGTVQEPILRYSSLTLTDQEISIIMALRKVPSSYPIILKIVNYWQSLNQSLSEIGEAIKKDIQDNLQK